MSSIDCAVAPSFFGVDFLPFWVVFSVFGLFVNDTLKICIRLTIEDAVHRGEEGRNPAPTHSKMLPILSKNWKQKTRLGTLFRNYCSNCSSRQLARLFQYGRSCNWRYATTSENWRSDLLLIFLINARHLVSIFGLVLKLSLKNIVSGS